MTSFSHLDILLYAHDGRGLGHISRAVAIGLAVRRMFPKLKVAVITGSRFTQMLCDELPLEIIKLPSYEVMVDSGESVGTASFLNLDDDKTARLRSRMIVSIVSELKPRCILVDHIPLGKRAELRALQETISWPCSWVLGMRAVPGKSTEIHPNQTDQTITNIFKEVFWYGDSTIAPPDLEEYPWLLSGRETGYISRAYELQQWKRLPTFCDEKKGCTVAFSWVTEATLPVIKAIADVAAGSGRTLGTWRCYFGRDYSNGRADDIIGRIATMSHCTIAPLNNSYLQSLMTSAVAIVASGYNSLSDILWAQTPSVAIVRLTKDKEQIRHISQFTKANVAPVVPLFEAEASPSRLEDAIHFAQGLESNNVKIQGSEVASSRLAEIVEEYDV